MKSIVYILHKFPNLTETFILNEIQGLKKDGILIKVFSVKKGNYLSEHSIDIEGIIINYFYGHLTLVNIKSHFYLIALYFGKYFRILSEIIFNSDFSISKVLSNLKAFSIAGSFLYRLRRDNTSLIHGHFIGFPTSIAMYMSQLSGLPFSCTAHANDIYKGDKLDILNKIAKAKMVVTCTLANKIYLSNLCPINLKSKVVHIYHGINSENWFFRNNQFKRYNEFNILCIGRLVEKKGIQYLLEAVEILVKKGISVRCSIIGNGPLLSQLMKITENKNLNTMITFHGALPHSHLKHYYNMADCFVLPCIVAKDGDRDGLPNVLLEAMCSGIPVISTSGSAISEIIEDKVTGLLISQYDSSGIATAILELINNPQYGSFLTKNALKVVESKFNIETSTKKLKEIFVNQYEV